MYVDQATQDQLQQWHTELTSQHEAFKSSGLNLDLTRGKPSSSQLDLANILDGALEGNYITDSGTDTRNYGGLTGLPEMRALGAEILGVNPVRSFSGRQ